MRGASDGALESEVEDADLVLEKGVGQRLSAVVLHRNQEGQADRGIKLF